MGYQEAYRSAMYNDPKFAYAALGAQWENLKTAFGISVVPIIVPAIMQLTEGLNEFARWAQDNPRITDALTYSFIGLSASLAFTGVVLTLTAGFKALRTVLTLGGLIPMLFRAATGIGAVGSAAAGLDGAAIGAAATSDGRLGTAHNILGGVLSRLAGPLAFLYEMWPAPTQGPDADRAPYGGMSPAERFPGSVVPPSVPTGPVAPDTVMPPMPLTRREWHQEMGLVPYQPDVAAPPRRASCRCRKFPTIVVRPQPPPGVTVPPNAIPKLGPTFGPQQVPPAAAPSVAPMSQTEWFNQEAEKQRQREAALAPGAAPPPAPPTVAETFFTGLLTALNPASMLPTLVANLSVGRWGAACASTAAGSGASVAFNVLHEALGHNGAGRARRDAATVAAPGAARPGDALSGHAVAVEPARRGGGRAATVRCPTEHQGRLRQRRRGWDLASAGLSKSWQQQ